MKVMHTLAYSWNKMEKADWNCKGLWSVSCDCSGTCHSLSGVPTLDPFALWSLSTLGRSLQQLRGLLSCEGRNRTEPRIASERAGTAITAAYRGSASEVVQDSDWGQDHYSPHADQCQALAPAPLALAQLPSPVKVPVLGAGRTDT